MPKTVDHAQRRAEIADALVRVAGRDGLAAVTMRSVAAESGVSLRLVQYYFATKAGLIRGALDHLTALSHERWARRLAALPTPRTARAFVDAFVAEALPTDAASRQFHLVGTSYVVLAMTDPELAAHAGETGPARLERELAEEFARARTTGEMAPSRDPEHEAARLVALVHAIGTTVMIGSRGPDAARAIITTHLNEIFADAESSN